MIRQGQNILILGGTGEARTLASALVERGATVTTSLAGRTTNPSLPAGAVRFGGFGGADGLAHYVQDAGIERIILATHPYATQISRNAVLAAQISGVPILRLMRPEWVARPSVHWLMVESIDQAVSALPAGARVLLTTGHHGLSQFLARQDYDLRVRLIEPPDYALPSNAQVMLSRPPYTLDAERDLLGREGITHLVTKNSGGGQTAAKLDAAQALDVTVVMIARPFHLPAQEVESVAAVLDALDRL